MWDLNPTAPKITSNEILFLLKPERLIACKPTMRKIKKKRWHSNQAFTKQSLFSKGVLFCVLTSLTSTPHTVELWYLQFRCQTPFNLTFSLSVLNSVIEKFVSLQMHVRNTRIKNMHTAILQCNFSNIQYTSNFVGPPKISYWIKKGFLMHSCVEQRRFASLQVAKT